MFKNTIVYKLCKYFQALSRFYYFLVPLLCLDKNKKLKRFIAIKLNNIILKL